MKIESIIRRPSGTIVEMDAPKKTYHFKPEDDAGPHVADVDVEDHALALLRIKDGYRPADGEKVSKKLENEIEQPDQLNGSTVHSGSYTINGEDISLDELVQMAFYESGLSNDEWNALADQQRYALIDTTLHELQSGTGDDTLHPQDDDGDDAGDGNHTVDDGESTDTSKMLDPYVDKGVGTGIAPNVDPGALERARVDANNLPTEPPVAAKKDDAAKDDKKDDGSKDIKDSKTTSKAAKKADDKEVPLNQRPKAELAELFEKKTGVKPSSRMSIADLVAGIEEGDE